MTAIPGLEVVKHSVPRKARLRQAANSLNRRLRRATIRSHADGIDPGHDSSEVVRRRHEREDPTETTSVAPRRAPSAAAPATGAAGVNCSFRRLLRLLLRLLQQRRHVGPERLARRALLRRQLLQGGLVADAGQLGVLLPVRQDLRQAAAPDLALGEQPRRRRQVGAQPGQRLTPQRQPLLAAETGGVLDLSGAGQSGGAGGVVAVVVIQIVG